MSIGDCKMPIRLGRMRCHFAFLNTQFVSVRALRPVAPGRVRLAAKVHSARWLALKARDCAFVQRLSARNSGAGPKNAYETPTGTALFNRSVVDREFS